MSENNDLFFTQAIASQGETTELIEKLFEVANADAVISQPISEHGHTAIIASEIMVGLGAGYGNGRSKNDFGNGGGGGGFSMGRPVALIQIGPDGVRQESLFDVTKVGLATIATLGSIFLSWQRVRRASRK